MKKFKFRLETVLKQRRIVEDLAKKALAQAQAELSLKMAEINDLYESIDNAREQRGKKQEAGGFVPFELESAEGFIRLQEIKIEREKLIARQLMTVVEEVHEALVEAATERMAMEKLKEKKKEAYIIKARKDETKKIEDIVVMRSRRMG